MELLMKNGLTFRSFSTTFRRNLTTFRNFQSTFRRNFSTFRSFLTTFRKIQLRLRFYKLRYDGAWTLFCIENKFARRVFGGVKYAKNRRIKNSRYIK